MRRKRVTSTIISFTISAVALLAVLTAARVSSAEEPVAQEKKIHRFELRPVASVSLMKDKELEKNPSVSYEIPLEWQEAKPKQRRKFGSGGGTGIAIGAIAGTGALVALGGIMLAPNEEGPLVAGGVLALAGAVVGIIALVTRKDEDDTKLSPMFDGETAGIKGSVKF